MGSPQLFDPEELEAQENAQEPTDETSEVVEARPDPNVVYQEQYVADTEVTPEPEPEPQPEPELPEKYQGKSIAELVNMHQEAERALGRSGSEVGELRKIVDNFIQTQTVAQTAPQQEPEEELDFYTDPEKAIRHAVDNHPGVQQAQIVSQKLQQGVAKTALKEIHPDYQTILNDPKFHEWKDSRPGLQDLFVRADGYDVQAADTIFSLWKERANVAATTVQVDAQARKQAAKAASTGNANAQPQGARSKKVYRRADLIKLMNEDPDRYMAMQPEILAAYKEKRVK